MRVALLTTFNAGKKEPLAAILERIHEAFLASGQGEPLLRFSFADAPVSGFISSVDRVLKRYPGLERFVISSSLPNGPQARRISNGPDSPVAGESVPFATLLAIAAGVPKSFPFHSLSIQLCGPAFGEPLSQSRLPGVTTPGVIVSDSWWINGRVRSLTALTIVEADSASKKLPSLTEPVLAVFAACGKVKSTVQVPFELGGDSTGTTAPRATTVNPETALAVRTIAQDFRARLDEVLERAALPHDLPPPIEAMKSSTLGQTTGPKKPVLVRAFKPLGYECRAGSGTFTLRRRTPANLTVEISLDVGTWSRSVTASFKVQGLGFKAILPLPVSRHAIGGGQYPIGDADRWQQIVDNLAALTAELDRSFVPAIEEASGPAPEWYRP